MIEGMTYTSVDKSTGYGEILDDGELHNFYGVVHESDITVLYKFACPSDECDNTITTEIGNGWAQCSECRIAVKIEKESCT